MATIYEVSALAGVSLATVSRVINDSERVRDSTREKVQAAMLALDYRPNRNAQSLASNRSNSVGILVPELHGPFYGTMLSGIEAELRTAGKHAIITVGHSEEEKERAGIEFLSNRSVDALILVVDALSDDYMQQLSKGAIPTVFINRQVPGIADRCISVDNELGGYMATHAALTLNHRQIAYIAGPLWKHDASERLRGHHRALAEAGIEIDPALIVEGDFQEAGGHKAMQQLLDSGAAFSAVVCANDEMAAAAMQVASESGLRLPEDLSIIGFDNVNFCHYLHPKLATVEYPINGMGQMAARWVLRNVYKDESLTIENVIKPRVLSRASMQRPAQGH